MTTRSPAASAVLQSVAEDQQRVQQVRGDLVIGLMVLTVMMIMMKKM